VPDESSASTLELLGAAGFGAVIGWYLYHVNRYRTGEIQITDVVTVIGALGGGAILTLFPAQSDLFGAYGIGLFAGFFAYFLALVAMVWRSDKFGIEWFLDGRRKRPEGDEIAPEAGAQRAMGEEGRHVLPG
jgi:hypothetical protein